MAMDKKEIEIRIKAAQINNALGVFLFFFGLIIIGSMGFTDNGVEAIIDFVAGLVIGGIGGGMILRARHNLRKLKLAKDH